MNTEEKDAYSIQEWAKRHDVSGCATYICSALPKYYYIDV
jgi:hypothetical protein